jgi:mevalonate kinase
MKQAITVSAPGKLMLFGEHAVVYDHPCIVTAVSQRLFVTIQVQEKKELTIEAPDVEVTGYTKSLESIGKGDIPKGVRFIESAVKQFTEQYPIDFGITITTKSDFSSSYGFGSSSASTVCVMKALAEIFEIPLSNQELFDLSYASILAVQGTGSGFDIAASIYGGTVYFVTGGRVIEPLFTEKIPLVIGYSGVKADTVSMISSVAKKAKESPDVVDSIYSDIEKIVNEAKEAVMQSDWKTVGQLMNKNQELLVKLGVSSVKLDAMTYAANNAGAFGAKLSGAGGGDCIIAISSTLYKVDMERAIEAAGGEIIQVETNAEGVRAER